MKIIQRELPVDFLEFFNLTPLPGSQDHQELFKKGVWMDPDLNNYDLFHVTTGHKGMSPAEWRDVYRRAWETYYTPEHVETLLRRARASRIPLGRMLTLAVWFAGTYSIEKVHPLEGGYLRFKSRTDRRPDRPRENPVTFYVRYAAETIVKHVRFLKLIFTYHRIAKRVMADPAGAHYTDLALTPPAANDRETLELFTQTRAKPVVAAAS